MLCVGDVLKWVRLISLKRNVCTYAVFSGKNLNIGYHAYVFWKAERFNIKQKNSVETWISTEATEKTMPILDAVERLHLVMAKIVCDRESLFFMTKTNGACCSLDICLHFRSTVEYF